jgi:hypothetical protein
MAVMGGVYIDVASKAGIGHKRAANQLSSCQG